MAFGSYKSIGEVALPFQIAVGVESFVQPVPLPVNEQFRARLTITLRNMDVHMSEASVCEFLIAPVLWEIWQPHSDALLLWSHVPLGAEEPLIGVPDYYFSRRSPLGLVRDQPYVLVVQAKQDDFEEGWGQCLAAMLAAQRLNDRASRIIHGCVSNGSYWEFARLDCQEFTREEQGFVLSDLPGLFAAWNYIIAQAREQALASAA
ncbi:MAG: hypothetical protein K2R98_05025 [Gemmataceae bacterium]|nr:hypothetical protein [Gemmataceae bacterium]